MNEHNVIDQATFEELISMVGDDFIGELIDTFLEDAPQLLEALRSSLNDNDVDVFRRSAHSLKSNAASFGAHALSDQAKELETLGREQKLDQVGDKLDALIASYDDVKKSLTTMRHEYK
jgi:HPt (histidine-containing phosphotransfer) domain-containing protein